MASFLSNFWSTRLILVLLIIGVSNGQMSTNFYASTCPLALFTIRTGVSRAVVREARMGASLLNLHFRDCFVNGCDASVLLDDTANFTGEKTAGPNASSLRGFDVIDDIKALLETICPGVVSCADILAVAARDSVFMLGGPGWTVPLGRRDSTTASLADANNQIPTPELNINALITSFSNKGFTPRELVALSGAHTIGQARCTTFRNRMYNEINIDPAYANNVRQRCPRTGGDNNLTPLDTATPNFFNNGYFRNLVIRRGLLHSDQQLFNNGPVDALVRTYSTNEFSFRNDFANAMVKMSTLSPLTGANGQIRTNCRRTN